MRPESSLVAIGVPVFNAERWIEQTLESLLNQSYGDFSLVISDNASTDGTAVICERFARADGRVRYFRNSVNVGVFNNYDRVFELSSSKYFKWAAAGDICKPTYLECCVEALESRPDAVLAYPRTAIFSEDVEEAQPYDDGLELQHARPFERFRLLLRRIRLNNVVNGLIRSTALRRTALNRPHAGSDVCLVAELALQGKFVEIPEVLFLRRMSRDTATALMSSQEAGQYFVGDAVAGRELLQWRVKLALLDGVRRAPIPWSEKISALRMVGRQLFYARKELIREVASVGCRVGRVGRVGGYRENGS